MPSNGPIEIRTGCTATGAVVDVAEESGVTGDVARAVGNSSTTFLSRSVGTTSTEIAATATTLNAAAAPDRLLDDARQHHE